MNQFDAEKIKKLQALELEMAKMFVDYCQSNSLLVYFCGGGCIGAVRHHGFIPWDDDLDFFMPRKDYEKLKKIWTDTEQFTLRYPTATDNDHNIFMTLRDKHTTMIKTYQEDYDIPHGVALDIFPLDGCPSGIRRKKQLFWALVYQLFCAQMIPENHGNAVRMIGKTALGLFRTKGLRYRIWMHAEKKMSRYSIDDCRYITELCAGPKYMRNEYPKELFKEAVMFEFEQYMMPIPAGYDGYLKQAFGDYMKLPPEEQRLPSHDAYIDLTKPYTVYKGIKYCRKP